MAKYQMSDCTLGHAGDAEEFRPHGIGVISLWPRTAIATAALHMIPGVGLDQCREPELLADAAYLTLTSDATTTGGDFLIDAELLARHAAWPSGRGAKTSLRPGPALLARPLK